MGLGIGGHTLPNRGISVEWETPPDILAAVSPIDDDPCLPGAIDGLTRTWNGFVFMNPPYGRDMWPWLEKLALHGNGIALIFARTETVGFQREVWGKAKAILFLSGRPHYYRNGVRADGNSGGPVCLVAYGELAVDRLRNCNLSGALVTDWGVRNGISD